MDTLTELYNEQIVPKDAELEKQAAEFLKEAEEEDAAGRIMARGFADELNKLAMPPSMTPPPQAKTIPVGTPKVPKPATPRPSILGPTPGAAKGPGKTLPKVKPQPRGVHMGGSSTGIGTTPR